MLPFLSAQNHCQLKPARLFMPPFNMLAKCFYGTQIGTLIINR